MKTRDAVTCILFFLAAQIVHSAPENDFAKISSGSGVASGLLSVILVDQTALAKTLPERLHLAPEMKLPNGLYPVAMFIGHHDDLRAGVFHKSISVAKHYDEATFTFVVVGPNAQNQRYQYTSKIVVDSIPAQLMGLALGYPKRLVSAIETSDGFEARFFNGQTILTAHWEAVPNYDQDAFQKNFALLTANPLPTVGLSPAGYICFDFHWDFASGTVTPVNVQLQLSQEFVGDQGLAGNYVSASEDKSLFGSTRITTPWTIDKIRRCK